MERKTKKLLHFIHKYGMIMAIKEVQGMPQIIPIKELKNTSEISELCHKTEGPVFITKNGYGDMAIMSMEIYESMVQQLAMYQELELSGRQAEEGQVREARTSLAEMRTKYGI